MSRSSLVAAVVSYTVKVWMGGLAAAAFVPLSLLALVADVGLNLSEPLSPRVLAASARLEAALDVHGDLTDVRVAEPVAAT